MDVSNNDSREYDDKHAEQATGFYYKMCSGRFLVSSEVLKLYLVQMYYLSKELQTENINWTDVQFELSTTKYSSWRSHLNRFLKK